MRISLIAAVSDDGFVADEHGQIPWRQPGDLNHFVRQTQGGVLIVGRTTFDQLPQRMIEQHDRRFIVLSRTLNPWSDERTRRRTARGNYSAPDGEARYRPDGVYVEPTIEHALTNSATSGRAHVWIIGGPQVWAHGLGYASEAVISRVHTVVGRGIAWAPDLEGHGLHLASTSGPEQKPGDEHPWSVEYWRR